MIADLFEGDLIGESYPSPEDVTRCIELHARFKALHFAKHYGTDTAPTDAYASVLRQLRELQVSTQDLARCRKEDTK